MRKKKSPSMDSILKILAGVSIVSGALAIIIVSVMLPGRVGASEKKITDIERYILEQRIQNEIMQKIVEKNKSPIISKNGKWWWDDKLEKWRPIKELK